KAQFLLFQIRMKKKDFRKAKKAVNISKAHLKVLETAAVNASNAYRKTSTYLRGVGRGKSTN
ncbi:unnamed protein product, partial [Trichobilharzia szidati]